MKKTGLRILYHGKILDLVALVIGGKCHVQDFIDGLEMSDQRKITALLDWTAANGLSTNREKFKKLEEDIFEFKSFRVRILCTIRQRQIIMTHGVIKKKNHHDIQEIERARRLLEDAGFGKKRKKA